MSPLVCSFCAKSQGRVNKLIAGPGVYICNECVDLCREIIDADPGDALPTPPPPDTTPSVRAIRLPVHLVESANRITRAECELVIELGREPTAAEIAEAIGMGAHDVESIKRRVAQLTQP